ncbi:MAG: hypothetical protein ACHQQQ_11880 [Bacteroidota bacterium]
MKIAIIHPTTIIGVNMYIIVEHEISNAQTFWETAKTATAGLPSHLKVHQTLPNKEGTKAVCLWEARSVDEVKGLIEPAVGKVSRNTYFAVELEKAMGLPTSINAAVMK